MAEWAASPALLEQVGVPTAEGAAPGSFSTNLVDVVLTNRILFDLHREQFDALEPHGRPRGRPPRSQEQLAGVLDEVSPAFGERLVDDLVRVDRRVEGDGRGVQRLVHRGERRRRRGELALRHLGSARPPRVVPPEGPRRAPSPAPRALTPVGASPRVVVAGLGPAGPDLLTAGTLAAIDADPAPLPADPPPPGRRRRAPTPSTSTTSTSRRRPSRRSTPPSSRRWSRARSSTARCSTPCRARRSWPSAPSSSSWPTRGSTVEVLPALSFLDLAWARLARRPGGARRPAGRRPPVRRSRRPASAGPLLVGQCDQRPRAVRHQAGPRRRPGGRRAPAPRAARRVGAHGGVGRPRPRRRARPPHLAVDPRAGRARGRRGGAVPRAGAHACAPSARGTASRPTPA